MFNKVMQVAGGRVLAEKAPEIIHEMNPVTWFERIINELHYYQLEKEKIETQYALDKQKCYNELAELQAKKEIYLASIDQQRKFLETTSMTDMKALEQLCLTIEKSQNDAHDIMMKIINADIPLDERKFLFGCYKHISSTIHTKFQDMKDVLDQNRQKINDTFKTMVSHQQQLRLKD